MITQKTVYVTSGKQFDTLQKAIDYREGLVDEFLSSAPGFYELRHSKRIDFVQYILDNREQLIGLLSFGNYSEEEE